MLLGAGKILQHCAERLVLHDSQIHLNRLLHYDAGLGGAFGQHLLHQRHAHESGNDLLRPAGGSQDIDVAYSFLRPAKAACGGDVLQAFHASQIGQNIVYNGLGCAEENASAALFVPFNGF